MALRPQQCTPRAACCSIHCGSGAHLAWRCAAARLLPQESLLGRLVCANLTRWWSLWGVLAASAVSALSSMDLRWHLRGHIADQPCIVSRSGYLPAESVAGWGSILMLTPASLQPERQLGWRGAAWGTWVGREKAARDCIIGSLSESGPSVGCRQRRVPLFDQCPHTLPK
jgi:hypothetical protein